MTHNHRVGWSKKKKAGFIAIIFLTIFAILLVAGGLLIVRLMGKFNFYDKNENLGGDTNNNAATPLPTKDEPRIINDNATKLSEIELQGNTKNISNILLLGVDNVTDHETIRAHSDTVIILSINRNDNTIRMASLMRDTFVWKPDGSKQYKLNAAFFEGGFNEIQKVLINEYRIQIDRVVAINFSVFSKLVNTIGGIDVELNAAELSNIKKEAKSTPTINKDGTYHLDGGQALAFSRNRSTSTDDNLRDDFGRTSRQRKTIEAILKKAKTLNVTKLFSAVETVVEQVHTNFSSNEIFNYLTEAPSLLKYRIVGFNYPNYGEYSDDRVPTYGSVLIVDDPVKMVLRLHHELFD